MEVLRGDWLTTGPTVARFETAFAEYVGAENAIAVSSGTAALHLCMLAAGVGVGDEVIVPALTFAASANCVRYVGGTVVFADVRQDTLTIDTALVASLVTPRTKAIVAVDYAGLPSDLDALRAICDRHGLFLVEDACHAPGAEYRGRKVGGIADLTTFSFHPVKHFTTAEGGMVTANDPKLAAKIRILRNHGITTDHRQREELGTWEYDQTMLGFNYRLSDLQSALGLSQLKHASRWLGHRRAIASRYSAGLAGLPLSLPVVPPDRTHAYHLYPVRLITDGPSEARAALYDDLRRHKIGVNVHYRPVYWHSSYESLGYARGLCPVTESAYASLLSLPMWHGLTSPDCDRVIDCVRIALGHSGLVA